ncbi:MAG: AgmX/PglI C-terminal domain-containing protein [Bacteriovoracaceae bacterium]|jgi:hypothetical protein|nr:hypothetical protein [Halobacteriovoraceae bacterium]MDP7319195.1 AgmX/PglI C-terminal domain-containing protein [Bacteriovoracaceae bacterium]|tara:strand:- start:229 stop:1431 length:1203 start_codon:yes stop_codon:yes gene_type:complete
MIAVETIDGELIKVFSQNDSLRIGLHKLFGFITEQKALSRLAVRKRQGHEFDTHEWYCQLDLKVIGEKLEIKNMHDCQVENIASGRWKLISKQGEFYISQTSQGQFGDYLIEEKDENSWLSKSTEWIMLGIFLLIPILYFSSHEQVEAPVEEKKEIKPVSVQVVQQVKAVNISSKKPSIKVKPLNKAQKAKRAVERNLGFLGLVGSKDLKKAVGGVPQKLKKATAGAGKGGDAGSGGEVLTGLGKGLKKTTVGNTGVAGLGGVGTKGAGGGAGGYGNTMVASGEGKGVSAISVASNDMVLDGGLSRYAVNATIAKYLSQVRRCYENQLNKNPGLEGLVTVNFQINGSGRLDFSKIKNSTLNNSKVESCITTKMMTWKFPKPKGGVKVNIDYPFMLRPVGK